MAGLTNCEFMVKGYHYTEPTTPVRVDSCRAYIDTTVTGEGSTVTNEVWTPPSTATLDNGFFNSYTSESNAISLTTWETASDNAILNVTGTNISSFTAKNWPITLGDLKNNYSYSTNSTAETALSALIGSNPGIYYYWNETNADVATYRANASSLGSVTYICSEPYRLRLKGIHGFYVQT